MQALRQVYAHSGGGADADLIADMQQPDLENGKRKRYSGSWRRQMVNRMSKLHASRLLVGGIATGAALLLFIYLRLGGLQEALSGSLRSEGLSTAGAYYPYPQLGNLIMVAGHAVYTSRKCAQAEDEGAWFLESYQRHHGQAASFLEHIHRGVDAASRDNQSLLLFSGGETRKRAGPRSEAQSYWSVAETNDWFGHASKVRERALTEEHARDSFENLLFSICRFRELTGKYPHNITVISYNFKQRRFADLHRAALKFPAERFSYIGTLPASSSTSAALVGELRVQDEFRKDPYGCAGSLRIKRMRRDPFRRFVPYPAGCPEIAPLFSYCGTSVISLRLPWGG